MSRNELLEIQARLDGSVYLDELKRRRDEVVKSWTASSDQGRDLLLKGEKRVYDNLIAEIESAQANLNNEPRSGIKSSDRF